MDLLRLGHVISPRLPTELVWLILTHLPVEDILRLIGDSDDATMIHLLLSNHPFFTTDRRLHVLLMTDPAVFQTYLVPGLPVPPLTFLEPSNSSSKTMTMTASCCCCCNNSSSSNSSNGTIQQQQQQQHFYSVFQPLELVRKEGVQIEFAPREGWWWVRMRGVMGIAVVLAHKNIIIKRSLHAVHPARQPRLERQAYFGGSVEFEHRADLARVTRCNVSMDWFCC